MLINIKGRAVALLFILGLFLSVPGFAQPTGPTGPSCWPPPCTVPINSGILLLLGAGMAYGFYMLYKMRKRRAI